MGLQSLQLLPCKKKKCSWAVILLLSTKTSPQQVIWKSQFQVQNTYNSHLQSSNFCKLLLQFHWLAVTIW